MATEPLYRPDHVGDWGIPTVVSGGEYGTDTFARPDGVSLFFRYWTQPNAQAPVLVLVHGLGAHTGWFVDMGSALNERGLAVYAVDLRGFGRSGGPRGHVRRGADLVDDCAAFVAEVRKRRPGALVYLLGHSMGAILATYVAAGDARSGANTLAGLILLNPWIQQTKGASPPLGTTVRILAGGLVGSDKAPETSAGSESRTMTANPEARQMLDADTYWVRERSAAFLFQVGGLLRGGVVRQARRVRAPALVIQCGGDQVVVHGASRRLYEALGVTDKTWKVVPGMMHDAELEAERGPLDDLIAGWIERYQGE
ncbi:MAG TPA: alpha/beta fold hydrolase [Ktedonobacterales bacterium]|jgi:alpha-beta hydrolase superfamily lysophospholipase